MNHSFLRYGFATLLMASTICSGQKISPQLLGNNAWMSQDTYYGEIERLWGWMDNADYQLIRIGGHAALTQAKNLTWVYRTIDSVRAFGADVLLQVPSDFTEAQATEYIRQINQVAGKNVRYWSIGNEPDWQLAGGGNDPKGVDLSVAGVATYTRRIAQGLRTIDPTIEIYAGGTAWYNTSYIGDFLGTGANSLTGKDANGHYYIDGIIWNHYDANSPTRSVEMEAQDLTTRFQTVNTRRPDKPMQWMIGEYNANVGNDGVGEDMKTWSFQSGQNFAITYDVGMRYGAFSICPWSMHESGGARTNYDLGLFDGNNGNYAGRSSYWHTLMLGQNWRENALKDIDNQADLQIISMGDTAGTTVMILNTSKVNYYDFELRLDQGAFSGQAEAQITIEAGIPREHKGSIAAYTTLTLVFDAQGGLTKRYTYSNTLHTLNRIGPQIEILAPTPLSCDTIRIPGTLQAENYCTQFGIQKEVTTDLDGGENIGYSTLGDWLEYPLEIADSGLYRLTFRVASGSDGGSIEFRIGDKILGQVTSASTGGWQIWENQIVEVPLSAGNHTLRLEYTDGGLNVNYILMEKTPDSPVVLRQRSLPIHTISNLRHFDLLGRNLGSTP